MDDCVKWFGAQKMWRIDLNISSYKRWAVVQFSFQFTIWQFSISISLNASTSIQSNLHISFIAILNWIQIFAFNFQWMFNVQWIQFCNKLHYFVLTRLAIRNGEPSTNGQKSIKKQLNCQRTAFTFYIYFSVRCQLPSRTDANKYLLLQIK